MPKITTSITVDGKTCILSIPQNTRAVGRATSITCPLGPAPTRAWVLMRREDVDDLPPGQAVSLVWTQINAETGATIRTLTFPGLYANTAERVGMGGVGDANAVFLVELVDARFIAAANSDTGLIAANVRSYAQSNEEDGAKTYLDGTAGVSWAGLAGSLWASCGVLGAFPGLPYNPDLKPEGQRFIGTSGYHALNAFLDFLDCALCHNPLTGAYTIVQLGAAQTVEEHTNELKWDGESKTFPVGKAATINSYFPTHYRGYGQERDTEYDAQWADRDSAGHGFGYAATESNPSGIANALGVTQRWQDLPRVIAENLTDANAAARQTRANAVSSRYFSRHSVTRKHRICYGLINDVLPGGQVRIVQWRHLGSRNGTETEFVCGPQLPKDTGNGPVTDLTVCELQPTENYAGHDLARHTFPNYPRLPNIIQIDGGEAEAGEEIDPDAEGFHRGFVKRWVGGIMRTLEACAVRFVDDHDNADGQVKAIAGEYYGPARLSGIKTIGEDTLPLYLLRRNTSDREFVFFELTEDLLLAGDAEAEILIGDGGEGWTNSGEFIVVQDPYTDPGMWQGYAGYRGFARKHPGGERYDIVWMETIARWIRYQLQETLGGLNATADVLEYHMQGKDPGEEVEVYDPLALWTAWHQEDCTGLAHWNDRERRYEIVTPQLICKFLRATLYNDVCSSEDNIEVENHILVPQGYYSATPIPLPTVVENPRNHRGATGRKVLLMGYKDGADIKWEIIDMEVVEINVLTGAGRSGCSINFDTVKVFAETCAEEGEAASITFDELTVVTGSGFESGTETVGEEEVPYCRYVVQTRPICTMLNGDADSVETNLIRVDAVTDVWDDTEDACKPIKHEKTPLFAPCTLTPYEGDDICTEDCPEEEPE